MALVKKANAALGTLREKFGATEERLDIRGRLTAILQDVPNLAIPPEEWSSANWQGQVQFMVDHRKTLDDAGVDIAARLAKVIELGRDEDFKQEQLKEWEQDISNRGRQQIWDDLQRQRGQLLNGITTTIINDYIDTVPALVPEVVKQTWRAPEAIRKHLPTEQNTKFLTAKQAGTLAKHFHEEMTKAQEQEQLLELKLNTHLETALEEKLRLEEQLKNRAVESAKEIADLKSMANMVPHLEEQKQALLGKLQAQLDEAQAYGKAHELSKRTLQDDLMETQRALGEAQDQLRAIQKDLDIQDADQIMATIKTYVSTISSQESQISTLQIAQTNLQNVIFQKEIEVEDLEKRINGVRDIEVNVERLKAEKATLSRASVTALSDIAVLLTGTPSELIQKFTGVAQKRLLERLSLISISAADDTDSYMNSSIPYQSPHSRESNGIVTIFSDHYYSGQASAPFSLPSVVRYGLEVANNSLNIDAVQTHLIWLEQVVLGVVCQPLGAVTADDLALPFIQRHLRSLLMDILLQVEPLKMSASTENRMDIDVPIQTATTMPSSEGAIWRYLGAHVLLLMARLYEHYNWSKEAQAEFAEFLMSERPVFGSVLLSVARVRALLAVGADEDARTLCRGHASLTDDNIEHVRYMTNMISMLRLLFDPSTPGPMFIEGKLGPDNVSVLHEYHGEYVFVRGLGLYTYTFCQPHDKCGFQVVKMDEETVFLQHGSGRTAIHFKTNISELDIHARPRDRLAEYLLKRCKKQFLVTRRDMTDEVIARTMRTAKKSKQDLDELRALLGQ